MKQGTPLNAPSVAEVGSSQSDEQPGIDHQHGIKQRGGLQPGSVIPSQETLSLDEIQHKVATLADTAQSTLVQVNGNLNNISGDTRTCSPILTI